MAALYSLAILSAILLLWADNTNAVKRMRLHIDKIDVWSDNDILNVTYAIDQSAPYINLTLNVFKKIEDMEIHAEGLITSKGDSKHFVNFNATYSICQLLSLKSISPFAMMAFQHIKRMTNIPDNCPIPKGVIALRKFWAPESQVTPQVPEIQAEFRTFLYAINGGVSKMIANSTVFGHSVLKEVDPSTVRAKLPGLFGTFK